MRHPAVTFLDADAEDQRLFETTAPAHWRMSFSAAPELHAERPEIAQAEVLSPFVHSRMGEPALASLPALRLIATRSTGFDHIDLEACRRRGIVVCNVPEYGSATVAEHTFALLLALSRRIYEARQRTLQGSFSYRGLCGFDLEGKVLGVVGCGRIGQHVVRIANGFGMRVLVHDRLQDGELAKRLGFRHVSWPELLAQADVVSLHLPGAAGAAPLMNQNAFSQMKPGAVLINTARGSLVDEAALLAAVDGGHLAGAGLDVLQDENDASEDALMSCERRGNCPPWDRLALEHPLMVHPRILVTPHIGFNSREALLRIASTTVGNIAAFLEGHPRNRVA
jgi:D-lactate dehydrogenase